MTTIPMTYEDAVDVLKRAHAEEAPPDLRIYLFPDPDEHVVRFIEVSEEHPSEYPDTDTAWAIGFQGGNVFPWRSAVILASTEDWERIRRGELQLPKGWDLAECRQVWPE